MEARRLVNTNSIGVFNKLGNPVSRRMAVGCAIGLMIGAGLLTIAGCEQMPAASSAKTVQILATLRTAISVKSADRIAEIRGRIEELHSKNELNDRENEVLVKILDMATNGDWGSAEQLCHRFQRAQIQ
jgi:hypothetical protein